MGKIIGLTFKQEAAPEKAATPDVFVCPVCGKEYKTEDGLKKHIQEKHPGDEPTETGEPRE